MTKFLAIAVAGVLALLFAPAPASAYGGCVCGGGYGYVAPHAYYHGGYYGGRPYVGGYYGHNRRVARRVNRRHNHWD